MADDGLDEGNDPSPGSKEGTERKRRLESWCREIDMDKKELHSRLIGFLTEGRLIEWLMEGNDVRSTVQDAIKVIKGLPSMVAEGVSENQAFEFDDTGSIARYLELVLLADACENSLYVIARTVDHAIAQIQSNNRSG